MPKKTENKPKTKPKPTLTQKEKFIAYAEEHCVNEGEREFDRVFDKIVKAPDKKIP